jgi:hypothetical protein
MLGLDRKLLEEMLLVFADRYFVVTRDGTYLSVFSGPEGKSSFLRDPETLVGTKIVDALPAHLANEFMRLIEVACVTREKQSFEYSVHLKKIGEQFFEARISMVSEGQIIIVIRNITRRMNALNRERFVSNATLLLNSSLDYHKTLRSLLNLMVPDLGDYAVIRILDETGKINKIDVKTSYPEKEAVLNELIARYSWDQRVLHPGAKVVRDRKTIVTRYHTDEDFRKIAKDEDHFKLLKRLDPVSSVAVPLILGDRVLGSIQVSSLSEERIYSDDDVLFVEKLARVAVLAIERVLSHQEAVRAGQLSEEILKITSQGLLEPCEKIDSEIDLVFSMISQVEDQKLRKMIYKSLKSISRANEEIESKLDDLTESNKFWSTRKTNERNPHQFQVLLEEALSYSRVALGEKSIRIETDFPKNAASIFCNSEDVITILREWLTGLIAAMPQRGLLKLSLKEVGCEVILTLATPKSAVLHSEFEQLKTKFGSLGGRIEEKSQAPNTSLSVFILPAFNPS